MMMQLLEMNQKRALGIMKGMMMQLLEMNQKRSLGMMKGMMMQLLEMNQKRALGIRKGMMVQLLEMNQKRALGIRKGMMQKIRMLNLALRLKLILVTQKRIKVPRLRRLEIIAVGRIRHPMVVCTGNVLARTGNRESLTLMGGRRRSTRMGSVRRVIVEEAGGKGTEDTDTGGLSDV